VIFFLEFYGNGIVGEGGKLTVQRQSAKKSLVEKPNKKKHIKITETKMKPKKESEENRRERASTRKNQEKFNKSKSLWVKK
jgi:murein L,D-transpeptidase YafK